MAGDLVLLRHGQSQWNFENRFTGWVDVDLTDTGRAEAHAAGRVLAGSGLRFDIAYTSVLQRAIKTLWLALEEMDQSWIEIVRHWRLNERHYGALQGMDKVQTAARHGEAQVHVWRRSYDIPPPAMTPDDPSHPGHDPRYAHLDARVLPGTESLALTLARVLPLWHDAIAPQLKAGQNVLVAGHGNSLRALMKYLDGIGDDVITGLNIPHAIPIHYRLDDQLRVIESGYLGDTDAAEKAARAIANEGKAQ